MVNSNMDVQSRLRPAVERGQLRRPPVSRMATWIATRWDGSASTARTRVGRRPGSRPLLRLDRGLHHRDRSPAVSNLALACPGTRPHTHGGTSNGGYTSRRRGCSPTTVAGCPAARICSTNSPDERVRVGRAVWLPRVRGRVKNETGRVTTRNHPEGADADGERVV